MASGSWRTAASYALIVALFLVCLFWEELTVVSNTVLAKKKNNTCTSGNIAEDSISKAECAGGISDVTEGPPGKVYTRNGKDLPIDTKNQQPCSPHSPQVMTKLPSLETVSRLAVLCRDLENLFSKAAKSKTQGSKYHQSRFYAGSDGFPNNLGEAGRMLSRLQSVCHKLKDDQCKQEEDPYGSLLKNFPWQPPPSMSQADCYCCCLLVGIAMGLVASYCYVKFYSKDGEYEEDQDDHFMRRNVRPMEHMDHSTRVMPSFECRRLFSLFESDRGAPNTPAEKPETQRSFPRTSREHHYGVGCDDTRSSMEYGPQIRWNESARRAGVDYEADAAGRIGNWRPSSPDITFTKKAEHEEGTSSGRFTKSGNRRCPSEHDFCVNGKVQRQWAHEADFEKNNAQPHQQVQQTTEIPADHDSDEQYGTPTAETIREGNGSDDLSRMKGAGNSSTTLRRRQGTVQAAVKDYPDKISSSSPSISSNAVRDERQKRSKAMNYIQTRGNEGRGGSPTTDSSGTRTSSIVRDVIPLDENSSYAITGDEMGHVLSNEHQINELRIESWPSQGLQREIGGSMPNNNRSTNKSASMGRRLSQQILPMLSPRPSLAVDDTPASPAQDVASLRRRTAPFSLLTSTATAAAAVAVDEQRRNEEAAIAAMAAITNNGGDHGTTPTSRRRILIASSFTVVREPESPNESSKFASDCEDYGTASPPEGAMSPMVGHEIDSSESFVAVRSTRNFLGLEKSVTPGSSKLLIESREFSWVKENEIETTIERELQQLDSRFLSEDDVVSEEVPSANTSRGKAGKMTPVKIETTTFNQVFQADNSSDDDSEDEQTVKHASVVSSNSTVSVNNDNSRKSASSSSSSGYDTPETKFAIFSWCQKHRILPRACPSCGHRFDPDSSFPNFKLCPKCCTAVPVKAGSWFSKFPTDSLSALASMYLWCLGMDFKQTSSVLKLPLDKAATCYKACREFCEAELDVCKICNQQQSSKKISEQDEEAMKHSHYGPKHDFLACASFKLGLPGSAYVDVEIIDCRTEINDGNDPSMQSLSELVMFPYCVVLVESSSWRTFVSLIQSRTEIPGLIKHVVEVGTNVRIRGKSVTELDLPSGFAYTLLPNSTKRWIPTNTASKDVSSLDVTSSDENGIIKMAAIKEAYNKGWMNRGMKLPKTPPASPEEKLAKIKDCIFQDWPATNDSFDESSLGFRLVQLMWVQQVEKESKRDPFHAMLKKMKYNPQLLHGQATGISKTGTRL